MHLDLRGLPPRLLRPSAGHMCEIVYDILLPKFHCFVQSCMAGALGSGEAHALLKQPLANGHATTHGGKVSCIAAIRILQPQICSLTQQEVTRLHVAAITCKHHHGDPCCGASIRVHLAPQKSLENGVVPALSSPVKGSTAISTCRLQGIARVHIQKQIYALHVPIPGSPVQSTGAVLVQGSCAKGSPAFAKKALQEGDIACPRSLQRWRQPPVVCCCVAVDESTAPRSTKALGAAMSENAACLGHRRYLPMPGLLGLLSFENMHCVEVCMQPSIQAKSPHGRRRTKWAADPARA